jgi:glycerophosphoryl diester phosphodiesterase
MHRVNRWKVIAVALIALLLVIWGKDLLRALSPRMYVSARSAYWAVVNATVPRYRAAVFPWKARRELARIRADSSPRPPREPRPRVIAHAGGAVRGVTYSNSLEAMDSSYALGVRWFEVDFNWTTDGELVCVHDWGDIFQRLSGRSPGPLDLAEFRRLTGVVPLTFMTVETLADWMRAHPDARVVTDVKQRPIAALELIARRHADLIPRFIPQIYHFAEYDQARALGFRDLILTLYLAPYTDELVVEFSQRRHLLGITMSRDRGLSRLPQLLAALGTPSYVYVVNSRDERARLYANGVRGIYTDSLLMGQ